GPGEPGGPRVDGDAHGRGDVGEERKDRGGDADHAAPAGGDDRRRGRGRAVLRLAGDGPTRERRDADRRRRDGGAPPLVIPDGRPAMTKRGHAMLRWA